MPRGLVQYEGMSFTKEISSPSSESGNPIGYRTTFTQKLTLRLLMSYIYIYIYDISSLRVNDLTLILLTWRKW